MYIYFLTFSDFLLLEWADPWSNTIRPRHHLLNFITKLVLDTYVKTGYAAAESLPIFLCVYVFFREEVGYDDALHHNWAFLTKITTHQAMLQPILRKLETYRLKLNITSVVDTIQHLYYFFSKQTNKRCR